MDNFHITKSKINKLSLPKSFDINKIQIGLLADKEKQDLLGLKNLGDTILPSGDYGKVCFKNAYGETIIDKKQPKERRYVSTNWIYPYGNTNSSKVACDIYKYCWVRINIPPVEIELSLSLGSDNKKYIVAVLTPEIRKNFIKETINIFLEIFGECYVFDDEICLENIKRRKCNWELLPPGTKPSIHLSNQLKQNNQDTDIFDIARLRFLDKYDVNEIVEGTNGFKGYYAYIFDNHCILESAIYGNATYIIPKENWAVLSQKTKNELLNANQVIEKIVHTENWFYNIRKTIKKLENK